MVEYGLRPFSPDGMHWRMVEFHPTVCIGVGWKRAKPAFHHVCVPLDYFAGTSTIRNSAAASTAAFEYTSGKYSPLAHFGARSR
jgi:hypothetical protein